MILSIIVVGIGFMAVSMLVGTVCALVIARKLSEKYELERARMAQDLADAFRQFVTAPDDKTPSPLAVLADVLATLLAARIVSNLKDMMAGVESGKSREIQGQMIAEASASNPLVMLLANILPKKVRNQLLKNPQMIGALSKIGNMGGNGAGDSPAPPRHRG